MKKLLKLSTIILFVFVTSLAYGDTFLLMPYPKPQFFDNNGVPLSGGKVCTYSPSTSTPKATYTDSSGGTANTNPVILDSAGRGNIWLDGYYKIVLQDGSGTAGTCDGVTIWTVDNVSSGSGVSFTFSEWVLQPLISLYYINASQFSCAGDLRTTFPAFLRIKATVTAGTVYGTVVSSSYGTGTTTVTLLLDAGVLDSGLSAVFTGLLSPLNSSIPVSSTIIPVGTTLPYAGSSAPAGWLLCYGQAVSRTTYAALFGVLGTTYGSGDGSLTFNVPDMRGRSFIGLDNMGGSAASRVALATTLGYAAGVESHTHTNPSHSHTMANHRHTVTIPINGYGNGSASWPNTTLLITNGTGGPTDAYTPNGTPVVDSGPPESNTTDANGITINTTESIGPYLAGNMIIKY
jgi:microcystin-dependent protein